MTDGEPIQEPTPDYTQPREGSFDAILCRRPESVDLVLYTDESRAADWLGASPDGVAQRVTVTLGVQVDVHYPAPPELFDL